MFAGTFAAVEPGDGGFRHLRWGRTGCHLIPLDRLGAFVTKSITLHPRSGHLNLGSLKRRVDCSTRSDWRMPGSKSFCCTTCLFPADRCTLGSFHRRRIPGGVSPVGGNPGRPVAGGCLGNRTSPAPMWRRACLIVPDPSLTRELVTALRPLVPRSLIVKLTPNTSQLRQVAQAAQEGGADAIALVNTFLGMAINPRTRRSRLSRPFGGLSGPAIKPLALRLVWEVCSTFKSR